MKRWLAETSKGDINHDGIVNIFDIVVATSIYGCREDSTQWNPDADLAPPYGMISIQDMVTISAYYGRKTYSLSSLRGFK